MLKTSIRTLLLTHRVVRICTSCQIHARETNILFKLTESRTFSTGSVKCHDNEEEYLDSSRVSSTLTREDSLVTRGSRKRPLSPLERVSRLLPQDALSPEVMQLREQDRQRPDGDIEMSVAHLEHEADQPLQSLVAEETPPENSVHFNQLSSSESGAAVVLPGENLLVFGEILMAELYKKNQVEFRKMFTLKAGVLLQSSWGVILHDDIVGKPAGVVLKTNRGVPIFIRRVSLEDYVLHMRRGPAITYPKDAAVMLMMMDVKEGDCVLESGSGSGAMSLFLSRTVGSKGRVLSIDVREDHLKRATKNCKRWRTSWNLQHREEWPDNIQFHHADLCKASSLLAGHRFNAIALDLVNPHLGLPTALQHLHPGCVCAVYLVNITQVVDLLEGIRCSALPLLCERIVEVPVRHWWVSPAMKKTGQYCTRRTPVLEDHLEEVLKETEDETDKDETDTGEELSAQGQPVFGSVPYIARPHPEQLSHTAFLVKLRKYVQ